MKRMAALPLSLLMLLPFCSCARGGDAGLRCGDFRASSRPITGTPAGETVAAILSMAESRPGNIRPYEKIPQAADSSLAAALEYISAGDTASAAAEIKQFREALGGVCGAADFICAELEYCEIIAATR